MNQTPMTTREAVQIVCGEAAAQCKEFDPDCVRCRAVALLCEQYGLRLSDYFTDA